MVGRLKFVANSLIGVAFAAAPAFAQDEPGTAAKVGERVDRAIQGLKREAKGAGGAVREQYAKARASVQNLGVSGRVYGRLTWEKGLQGAKIDIDVRQDGIAVLSGIVADGRARDKAVELTRDTVGVTQVVDQLTLQTKSNLPAVEVAPRAKP